MMVGWEIDQLYILCQCLVVDNGVILLFLVCQLSDGWQLQDFFFDIQLGEIVGVVGLLGVGCDVLVDLFYGLCLVECGIIYFEGWLWCICMLKQVICVGMVLVLCDCCYQGLILFFIIVDNINFVLLLEIVIFGWEWWGIVEQKVCDWIEQLVICLG